MTSSVYDLTDRMKASVYDTDNDGVVNAAATLSVNGNIVDGTEMRNHVDDLESHLYPGTIIDCGVI